jgi:hypothetical protein
MAEPNEQVSDAAIAQAFNEIASAEEVSDRAFKYAVMARAREIHALTAQPAPVVGGVEYDRELIADMQADLLRGEAIADQVQRLDAAGLPESDGEVACWRYLSGKERGQWNATEIHGVPVQLDGLEVEYAYRHPAALSARPAVEGHDHG